MNNCTIYNKSFLDDIENLDLALENAVLDIESLSTLIENTSHEDNTWTPLFVDRSNSKITEKMMSDHGSMLSYDGNSNLLGMQNFLTINNPTFNFWNVANGRMTTDWVLNNSNSSHYAVSGLLCWFKKTIDQTPKEISSFPNNSRIKLFNTDRSFVKIDNNILYELNDNNKNSIKFNNSGSLSFNLNENNPSNNYIKIDSLGIANPLFILVSSVVDDSVSINNNKYLLWIPNGDIYSYYSTYDEFKKADSIPKSFCSSSLYSLYNNIYHQLTCHNIKNHDIYTDINLERQYKIIAKYIASSPYIDEYSINLLSDRNFILPILTNNIFQNFNLANILNVFVQSHKNINPNDLDYKNLNNNLIYSYKNLKEKLVQKYGSKLVFRGSNVGLSTKNNLKHGANVVVSQVGSYWGSKNLKNTIVFANQNINSGGLSINTNFSNKKSHILLNSPNTPSDKIPKVYLYDSAKPKIKNTNSLNVVMEKTTNNRELPDYDNNTNLNSLSNVIFKYVNTEFLVDLIKFNLIIGDLDLETYRASEDASNPSSNIANDYINCTWSRVSGPALKFIDVNKHNGARIDTTTDSTKITDGLVEVGEDVITGTYAYVVPSIAGRYQIKCDISTPFGNFVKIKTFYVVDGAKTLISNSGPVDNPGFNKMLPVTSYNNYGNIRYNSVLTIGFDTSQLVDPNVSYIDDIQYIKQREISSIPLNSDNLRVHLPNLKKIAINSNGLFYPINTNLTIKNTNSAPESLSGDKFKFQFYSSGSNSNSILNIIYQLNDQIFYKLDRVILENTRNNIDPTCADCLSFYYPQLYGSNGRWRRQETNISLEGWDEQNGDIISVGIQNYFLPQFSTDYSPNIKSYGAYDTNTIISNGMLLNDHPAPGEIFPAITGRPLDYKADNGGSDPPFYADDARKFCFEQSLPQPPNSYLTFEKGVFHPSSGWIPYDDNINYDNVKNLSNVLKFNPGARDSFNFTGPSINNIINDSYIKIIPNSTHTIAQTFRSEISLEMSIGAQWIQWSKKCDETTNPNTNEKTSSPVDWGWRNQIHREYADQALNANNFGEVGKYYNHGYRMLEGGLTKTSEVNFNRNLNPIIDEFGFDSNKNTNSFSYRFPTFGYHYPISDIPDFVKNYWQNLNEPEPKEKWKGPKNVRVPNFIIKDIEVKLNFLNYINTKDLSIVFESTPCGSEVKRIKPPCGNRFLSPINDSNKVFIDQKTDTIYDQRIVDGLNGINNEEISLYLKYLTYINTKSILDDPAGPLQLYLLNKEYVQNHNINLNLKFSDNANKFASINDHQHISLLTSKNSTSSFININNIGNRNQNKLAYLYATTNGYYPQEIVQIDDLVKPSISAINFSDYESYFLNRICSLNKLNIQHNSFAKYKNKSLFLDFIPCPCDSQSGTTTESPNHNGITKFACIITLYGEHDDMLPNDNLVDSYLYTNAYDFDNKLNTTQFFNSLCGWELYLHVGNTPKPTVPLTSSLHSYSSNDSLSLIDYGKPPKYPGYSFIANLRNYKHLLPYVNINAPNIFYQTSNLCETSDLRNIGRGIRSSGIEFPSLARIQIVNAIGITGGLSVAGSLLGVTAGLSLTSATSNAAYGAIRAYFDSLRTQSFSSSVSNDTYHQDYTSHPFGSPEKILINFSKDDLFWYKAEASIFKYKNTPVLSYKKYNYIRLNPNSLPALSRFSFNMVNNIKDLIDERYIKTLSVKCEEKESLIGPINKNGTTYNLSELVDVVFVEKPEESDCVDGLYLINSLDQPWVLIDNDPTLLHQCADYIINNDIIYGKNKENNLLHNFTDYIKNNKIIIIDGIIPYENFGIGEDVQIKIQNITELSTSTIEAKALIYKENKAYSVFRLNRDMSDVEYVSFNNNVIVLFDLQSSSDISNNPLNMYAFEKNSINISDAPDIVQSTNSIGSYGDGSLSKNKKTINAPFVYNNLQKLYNIFNNDKNDKIKYNNIVFSSSDNIENVVPTYDGENPVVRHIGGSTGYAHSITDVIKGISKLNQYICQNDTNNEIIQKLENELDQIKNNVYNNVNKNNYYLIYVKNNNFRSADYVANDSGYVCVENDYELNTPIQPIDINGNFISETLFTQLINKLNQLENLLPDELLESKIGQESSTNQIILSYNLNYLFQHYGSLTEYNQAKQRTEFALRVLYKERDDILELLNRISSYQTATVILSDDNSISGKILSENNEIIVLEGYEPIDKSDIKNITRNFVRNSNISKIRPQQKAIVSIKTGKDSAFSWLSIASVYDIAYENNNDDYWINLDPHQSCSIAEELRPKVLTSVSYTCRPVNYQQTIFGTPLLAENNICARKRGASVADGDVNFKTTTKNIRGDSFESYEYSMSVDVINKQKGEIENKAKSSNLPIKWKNQTIKRNYHINGKNDIDSVYSNSEILVQVEENYEVLLAPHEVNDGIVTGSKLVDADTNTISSNGSVTGEIIEGSIPGLEDGWSTARLPYDSPPGLGLLLSNLRGSLSDPRTGQSTKIYNVCNLDEINQLKVKFRKIPRQVRGVDLLSTIYRYGISSPYQPGPRRTIADPLTPLEIEDLNSFFATPLNNNFYYWKCMEIDNNSNQFVPSKTPLFFQLMNEMNYRNFYGSVDKIENKYDNMVSQFLWELIPYEYFVKPPKEE
jgi:hypothetical protein